MYQLAIWKEEEEEKKMKFLYVYILIHIAESIQWLDNQFICHI